MAKELVDKYNCGDIIDYDNEKQLASVLIKYLNKYDGYKTTFNVGNEYNIETEVRKTEEIIDQSILKTGIMENKFLIGSFVLGILVQTIVVLIPQLAEVFKLVPLTNTQWIITLIISILPIPIIEVQKFLEGDE